MHPKDPSQIRISPCILRLSKIMEQNPFKVKIAKRSHRQYSLLNPLTRSKMSLTKLILFLHGGGGIYTLIVFLMFLNFCSILCFVCLNMQWKFCYVFIFINCIHLYLLFILNFQRIDILQQSFFNSNLKSTLFITLFQKKKIVYRFMIPGNWFFL